MTEALHTTVVLLNLNAGEELSRCLEGLLEQTTQAFRVLLLDQGSVDGSTCRALAQVEGRLGERLEVVWVGKNLGFTGGVNLGLSLVKTRWTALLNTDAVPRPGWLEALVRCGEGSGAGMVASQVRLADGSERLDNTGHLLYLDGLNLPRGRGEPSPGPWTGGEVLCPSGCAGLYLTSALREVGGLEPALFVYGDDLELGLSLRVWGYGCQYTPDAVVYHQLSSTLGAASARKAFYVERNRRLVALKHFPVKRLLRLPWHELQRYGITTLRMLEGEGPGAAVQAQGGLQVAKTLLALGLAPLDALRLAPLLLRSRARLRAQVPEHTHTVERLLDQFSASLEAVGRQRLG